MIRVYRYGLLPPTQLPQEVREQMLLAHRYRNTLIEIERGRRAAVRLAESRFGSVAALTDAVTASERIAIAAHREIATWKAKNRSGKVPDALKDTLASARDAQKKAKDALYECRRALRSDPDMVAERDRINELAHELELSARKYCGVYWGTYLLIEAEVQASKEMPLYDGHLPNDPKFQRWTGEGSVGVQIQKGAPAEHFDGEEDSRLRIGPATETFSKAAGKLRAPKNARTLYMRIGSEGRDPIFAGWPMILHRPLPEGSRVKCAAVHVKRVGLRWEWSVTMTLEISDPRPVIREEKAVAIDVGWRNLGPEEGIRVASWAGSDGRTGELRLSPRLLGGFRKADDLRSIRDKNLTAVLKTMVLWLSEHAANVPEWLTKATATIAQWRSTARLEHLAERWRDNRFSGDEQIFETFWAWRRQERHLYGWECDQRQNTLLHRREAFRTFAAEMDRIYQTIVLEDFNLRDVAVRPEITDAPVNETARGQRHGVAVSELRGALYNRVGKGRVSLQNPAYTTMDCHHCGHRNDFDAAARLVHTCSACGALWDQDQNAAKNLLAMELTPAPTGEDVPASSSSSISGEEKESKWKRAKRLRVEKEARKEGRDGAAAEAAE